MSIKCNIMRGNTGMTGRDVEERRQDFSLVWIYMNVFVRMFYKKFICPKDLD